MWPRKENCIIKLNVHPTNLESGTQTDQIETVTLGMKQKMVLTTWTGGKYYRLSGPTWTSKLNHVIGQ